MKNIFKMLFLCIPFVALSQENMKSVLNELRGNGKIEICVKKFDQFIIGTDNFEKLKKGNHFELFDKNKTSLNTICLVKLNSNKDYDLFTFTSKDLLTGFEKNTAVGNAFGYYLLYSRSLQKMFCIESNMPGEIAYGAKKKITFLFNFNHLREKIYLINNDLFPISALRCFESNVTEKEYSLSIFETNKGGFIEKVSLGKGSYSSSHLIPLNNLIMLLQSKPLEFNSEKKCQDENCYSEITKIVLSR